MSNQTAIPQRIRVGDTVAYNQAYIDRQHLHGDIVMFARGKVLALHSIEGGVILADIEWDTIGGLSKRVYLKDIVKV